MIKKQHFCHGNDRFVARNFHAKRRASKSRALDGFERIGSKVSLGRVVVLPLRKAES